MILVTVIVMVKDDVIGHNCEFGNDDDGDTLNEVRYTLLCVIYYYFN